MILSQIFCAYFTILMSNFKFFLKNIACNSGRVGLARLLVYMGRVEIFQPTLDSGRANGPASNVGRVGLARFPGSCAIIGY